MLSLCIPHYFCFVPHFPPADSSIHPEMVKRLSMSVLRQYLRMLTVYIIDILDQFVILFLTGAPSKINQIAFRVASFTGNGKYWE